MRTTVQCPVCGNADVTCDFDLDDETGIILFKEIWDSDCECSFSDLVHQENYTSALVELISDQPSDKVYED